MDSTPVNIFEYEEQAKQTLPAANYDFIAGGATDEVTLRRTRAVYDSLRLRPRILVDVDNRVLSTSVLGQEIALPVMLAPTGGHGQAHPDGELASARAAGAMGTIMVVSVNSTYSWEDIGEVASGPLWAQMYIYRDRELLRDLIQRAEDSGYSAICVTVDSRVRGKRERDLRNKLQFNLSANYASLEAKVPADPNAPSTSEAYRLQDTSATWDDLEWVASNTKLPVTLKGVMTSEDAALAVEHGVKGIFVSNHGARQLDTVSATIEVLPEIAEAVDGRLEVYLDGGIRRGTDVLKALALGARAVLMGRPIFWGLAVGGEAGVSSVLTMLRDELDVAMALTGQPCVDAVDSRIVDTGPSWTQMLNSLKT